MRNIFQVRNCRAVIMQELEQVLAQQAPPPAETSHLFDLPPLIIDGMPTSLEKMTQVSDRCFSQPLFSLIKAVNISSWFCCDTYTHVCEANGTFHLGFP